jgi:hypothetical protein
LKRIVYLLVVILLFFQSGGLLLFFKMGQHIHQSKMDRLLERQNTKMEHFTISREAFTISRISGKEISVNGKMYDIWSSSVVGNSVNLVAVRDKDEESIIKVLKDAMRTSSNKEESLLVKIVKLLSLDYTMPFSSQGSILKNSATRLLPSRSELMHSRIADILTPPPEAS